MYSVALISPNEQAWSETFIRAHRDRLPAEVHYLYGAFLPRFRPDGKHFLSDRHLFQGGFYAMERILGQSTHTNLRTRIKRYLKKNAVRCVLAEYGPTGVEMLPICKALGLPLVVHFHGFDAYDKDLLFQYAGRYPGLFEYADAVVAVSQHMVQRLKKLGAPADKIICTPCGPNPEHFWFRDYKGRKQDFFACGRFSETKSPHLTILAFRKVLDRFPQANLRMAGEGDLYNACKILADSLGMRKKVAFLGVQPPKKVAQEMRKACAFVQHSLTTPKGDSEGTPVAILEAGLCGTPVVSTRHAGINDVVKDLETGLLCDEGDIEAMAANMIRIIENPDLGAYLGHNANKRIAQNFSLSQHIDQLWQVMEDSILTHKANLRA